MSRRSYPIIKVFAADQFLLTFAAHPYVKTNIGGTYHVEYDRNLALFSAGR